MKLLSSMLCLLSVSSTAFSLNLPNKTKKDATFKPAGTDLAADPDFAGKQDIYKDIALEVRQDPKLADVKAKELAMGEGKDAAEHRAIENWVRDELKKEALARQYVLLIDNSGSMSQADPDGGTRWGAAEKATEMLIDAMFSYDMDHKVPTYLFGDKIQTIGELTSKDQVMRLFREHGPDGKSTNLAGALQSALSDNLGKMRNNYEVVPGTTIVVLTDGAPNSESDVEQILKQYADPQAGFINNDEELAITFIQIGNDNGASEFLQRMDAGYHFHGKKMDICDTKKDDDLRKFGPEWILSQAIFD